MASIFTARPPLPTNPRCPHHCVYLHRRIPIRWQLCWAIALLLLLIRHSTFTVDSSPSPPSNWRGCPCHLFQARAPSQTSPPSTMSSRIECGREEVISALFVVLFFTSRIALTPKICEWMVPRGGLSCGMSVFLLFQTQRNSPHRSIAFWMDSLVGGGENLAWLACFDVLLHQKYYFMLRAWIPTYHLTVDWTIQFENTTINFRKEMNITKGGEM
jgi:hypothetical protein